jgi:hypothetical protein
MMSADAVGAGMPTQVTLHDLAAMAAADENHRYELSPEGMLSVMPPADPDHALRGGSATVHRFELSTESGEYEPVAGGGQPLTWLLTTVPDVS